MDGPPADVPVEVRSLHDYVARGCAVTRVEVLDAGMPVSPPENATLRWSGNACLPSPTLRVEAVVAGVQVGRWTARPSLDLWVQTAVAPTDITVGAEFEAVPGEAPWRSAQAAPLVGRVQARVPIRAGQPVTARVARKLPDAANGTSVSILIESGQVRVSAPGSLMGPGSIGRMVHVRNRATGQIHRGVLTAAETVSLSP
ncbi:MAG: flagella basal body P-ring formation protein FlgA [Myxococcota bacterium]